MTPHKKITLLAGHLEKALAMLAANKIGGGQVDRSRALLKRCHLEPHRAAARAEDDMRRLKYMQWRGEEAKWRVRQ